VYRLSPNGESLWKRLWPCLVGLTAALAVHGLYQNVVLGQKPSSVFLDPNTLVAALNLGFIVLLGRLLAARADSSAGSAWSVAVVLLALVLLMGSLSIGGRGGALGLAIGLFVLGGTLVYVQPGNRSMRVILGLVTVCVVGAATLALIGSAGSGYDHSLIARLLAGGLDIGKIMYGRTEIWIPSLKMLSESPWYGRGLGTYWLQFPPYRSPPDTSEGFHVHNDWLEFLIETGWPSLLFAGALAVIASLLLVRLLASKTLAGTKIEAASLYGALAGLAIHSIFNFNLYVIPVPWIAGILLGRLAHLLEPVGLQLRPVEQFFRWRAARVGSMTILAIIVGLLAMHAIGMAIGTLSYTSAVEAYEQNQLSVGDAELTRAERWMPYAEAVYLSHADLILKLVDAQLATSSDRPALLKRGLEILSRAERANPWRPATHLFRGHLYLRDLSLSTQQRLERAAGEYRAALALDPRFIAGRTALARILINTERPQDAALLLEDGLVYYYTPDEELLNYLGLTAHANMRTGHRERAMEIAQRVNGILRAAGRSEDFAADLQSRYP
jgi:tetratricopeptide (TPR) repeat protein